MREISAPIPCQVEHFQHRPDGFVVASGWPSTHQLEILVEVEVYFVLPQVQLLQIGQLPQFVNFGGVDDAVMRQV